MDLLFMREKLLTERRRRGLTQQQAARQAGLSQSTVSNLETGRSNDWGAIQKLCDLYEMSFEELSLRIWQIESAVEQAIKSAPELSDDHRSLLLAMYQHMRDRGPLASPGVTDSPAAAS